MDQRSQHFQPRDKNFFQRDASSHVTGFIDRREGRILCGGGSID
jgi:hypothetical protein